MHEYILPALGFDASIFDQCYAGLSQHGSHSGHVIRDRMEHQHSTQRVDLASLCLPQVADIWLCAQNGPQYLAGHCSWFVFAGRCLFYRLFGAVFIAVPGV